MKNKQYIKRCPMCGSKARLWEDISGMWAVQCNRCGVSTIRRTLASAALYEWNRRVKHDSTDMH